MSMPPFVTMEQRGRLTLTTTPAAAFPCFTPEGERNWVPGWTPEYLHPPDGALSVGLRFRTWHGGEETLWMVTDLNVARGRVTYARITPGSRYGTVTVEVRRGMAGGSEVEVTYSLTPLSADGAHRVGTDLAPDAFAEMLRKWGESISAWEARQR